jgi:hypothetical protein
MGEISQLKGLGAASEQQLNAIGVYTKKDLFKFALGPILMSCEQHRWCNG